MKKKGFTLIELLAVIVILAVIALIATPIVLNLIEKARKGAAESDAYAYVNAVETSLVSYLMAHNDADVSGIYTTQDDGSLKGTSELTINIKNNSKLNGLLVVSELKPELKGNKPASGAEITIGKKGSVENVKNMEIGGYKVSYDASSKKFKADVKAKEEPTEEPVVEKDEINVTIKGAPNEIITLSDNTSITLDSNGQALKTISKKVTSATGSISNYTKNFSITDSTTSINVYPDGAIYWYGLEIKKIVSNGISEKEINYISTNNNINTWQTNYIATKEKVNIKNYNSLKVKTYRSGTSAGNGSMMIKVTSTKDGQAGTSVTYTDNIPIGDQLNTLKVSGLADEEYYIIVDGATSNYSYATLNLYAIWLE